MLNCCSPAGPAYVELGGPDRALVDRARVVVDSYGTRFALYRGSWFWEELFDSLLSQRRSAGWLQTIGGMPGLFVSINGISVYSLKP
jgi:hypothetical protein